LSPLPLAIVCAAVVLVVWLALRRANEIAALDVLGGRLRVRRGRLPAGLRSDIEAIVSRRPVERATVRIVSEGGRPAVVTTGALSDAQKQQLRNVVGLWPLAKLRGR
jgi:hypothetical protein